MEANTNTNVKIQISSEVNEVPFKPHCIIDLLLSLPNEMPILTDNTTTTRSDRRVNQEMI